MANITTTEIPDTWELFNYVNAYLTWIIPIPVVLSLFGNTVTILVMRLPRNKDTSSGFLFLALAVSDIFLTFMMPVERWIMYLYHVGLYQFPVAGVIKSGLTNANSHISSWLLVIITIERTLSIFIPLRMKSLCSPGRTKLVVFVVVLLLMTIDLAGAALLIEVTVDPSNVPMVIDRIMGGIMIFSLTDLVLGFIIPYFVILVGSSCILIKLKMRKMVKHNAQNKVLMSVTMNLLAANLTFIVATAPFTINAFLTEFTPDSYLTWNVVWLLVDMNAALNFFVYVLSGSKFREDVKHIFRRS